ncbi:hypothetical protein PVAP13_9NG585214 [Panicum virgatum]|uniref:Uncharacterized protein n=1 Tax=Panicum virgatum TaxID=38727 RepID=A0A8T0MVT4_PANVG|nr:hypothetical protein PVAP13_9NG585214 [Panicum virgatum]
MQQPTDLCQFGGFTFLLYMFRWTCQKHIVDFFCYGCCTWIDEHRCILFF